jgi:hypothetical protein
LKSAFRKISRVGSLTGGTKWYLSEDCLLAAKRTMYAVEYRRFYLRDVESIVVWPNRLWLLRMVIRMGGGGTGTRADRGGAHSHHGSKR